MHFQFLGLFRKVRSGFHLHLISNLQKNNTDHFLLKSFLESIDIDIFFVRNGRWPESARKSGKTTEHQRSTNSNTSRKYQ